MPDDWKVDKPQILVMRGAATDNNATLFAQGYDGVLHPHFNSKKYVKVGEPAGTWDPAVARTTFEEQYTAHSNINAVVMPNDDNANAVISYLKTLKRPAREVPHHRTGRHADRAAECAGGLPMRNRLQAHLSRGAGVRGRSRFIFARASSLRQPW